MGIGAYWVTTDFASGASQGASARHERPVESDDSSAVHWRTVFEDEFSGQPSSGLGSAWRFYGGSGIGIGTFVDWTSLTYLDGHGHLVIGAEKTAHGWMSSEIETTSAFMPTPGEEMLVESRLELPDGGRGYWPAFWGLARLAITNPRTEPMAGEDDIAETIDNDRWIGQYMHCGRSNELGPCGVDTQKERHISLPSGESGWHLVSWLWYNKGAQSYVAFYVDNKLTMKVTERQIGKKYWTLSFDHPYVFIYDLAIGGWAGPPNKATAISAWMRVDYVRIKISRIF
jgi:hypothetical protein